MLLNNLFHSNNKIFIDGGTGSEIERHGGKMSSAWGAIANIDTPEIVTKFMKALYMQDVISSQQIHFLHAVIL